MTLSASVALTITIGITGTAIAVVLGFAVQLAAQFRFVTGHFETSIFRYWPHRQMIALVPAYVAGFAVARILDAGIVQPAGLLAGLIAGSATYAAAVIVIGGLLPRDREVGKSIARRILPCGRSRYCPTARTAGSGVSDEQRDRFPPQNPVLVCVGERP